MYFVLKVMKLNIDGTIVSKIVHVNALQIKPTSLTNANGEGDYLFETSDDVQINKLINDQEKVVVTAPAGTNTLSYVTLNFAAASQEPTARKIAASDWKVRVRPAFMRACTTTHLFNN